MSTVKIYQVNFIPQLHLAFEHYLCQSYCLNIFLQNVMSTEIFSVTSNVVPNF